MKRGHLCIAVALLALFPAVVAIAGAAEARSDATQKQKSKRTPVADFADEARMDVLRWLVKLEPAFATFQARFTYARPIFQRENAYSPRISVIVILPLTKSIVTFIASAEFADDLSKASKSRIDAFTASVAIEGKRYTLMLPPGEMKEFAADPDQYIEKAAARAK